MSGWRLLIEGSSFRWLWSARTVSFVGSALARTALMLHVQVEEGTGFAVGLLLLTMALPRLLGPIVGTVADRVDQRRLMMATDLGQMGVIGAMALFLPPFPVLLGLVTASTVLSTLFFPAGRSAIPELVSDDELGPANSLIGVGVNMGLAVGPAVAGFLFVSIGVRGTLAVTVATFAVSFGLLSQLPPLRPDSRGEPARFWVDVREGLTVVRSNSVARSVMFGLLFLVAFLALDNVAAVFLAQDVLEAGPEGFGLLVTAWGVGMILGPLLMIPTSQRVRPGTLFLVGAFLSGIGVLAAAASVGIAFAIAAFGVGGLGNGISNVATDTLVQEHVPKRVRGRVFGVVYAGALTGDSLASFLGGPLLDATSARTTLAVAGAGALVVVVAVRMMMPQKTRGFYHQQAPGED